MTRTPAAILLFLSLLKVLVCIQVIVPQQERSTTLFASVILRCDYTTSANLQDVLLTWRYKSFCKDPVLEYYSTSYQSALQLGQDPSNDCPDSRRTVRIVIQRKGNSEPILGVDYRERKISIQNKADLVISEVMWWDNGVYFCSVDAPGDTAGDSDKEIKLIVYNWLTVLAIILGGVLLIILLGICCCQCCPQKCCCYVRCPCCPQQCCCPEKAMIQHRLMKQAQRAMTPWLGGQPIYGPMGHASSQMNPLLYAGSVSGKSFPLKPMPLPPPQSSAYSMPPPSVHSNHANNNQMLDYLESQVRGMDMTSPLLQPQLAPPPHLQQVPPPSQHIPISVPFSPGPPSMISALDDGPMERRVITLPPIREQQPSRFPPPAPKTRPPSSSESNRSSFGRRDGQGAAARRYPSVTQSRGVRHSYSQDSLDGRSHSGARGGMDRPRSRSRDDLFDTRSRGHYSPPASRRSRGGSWCSDDDISQRGGKGRGGGGGGSSGGWVDKPQFYTEYEPGQKPVARKNERFSDKSARSGTSVII
ncbi:immunoglobulin-like domain-containing receptor 1 [Thalassophryne amazonica]|uniref:immunoglobulin-like domain-containing receptor 1 n=1 Tax=Thalassophryne amazonica TaxID=390379 RepID=UPI0014715360|nr:immunoglobulin-like domain-containing receptor 1 [Thalassophryne amazonica]